MLYQNRGLANRTRDFLLLVNHRDRPPAEISDQEVFGLPGAVHVVLRR
jgi:hypothetical protein